jgi:hypothetical protein
MNKAQFNVRVLAITVILPLFMHFMHIGEMPLDSLNDIFKGSLRLTALVGTMVAMVWCFVSLQEIFSRKVATLSSFIGRLKRASVAVVFGSLCLISGWLMLEGWYSVFGI